MVSVSTKTKDNVFVHVKVAVQQSVMPESTQEAMYKLDNVHAQIESYVADVVRSFIPQMTLDESFEKKDDISDAVQKKLSTEMANFGFAINKALVTEVTPNAEVVASMNEINKQKRLRDASQMAAEAEKIKAPAKGRGAARRQVTGGGGLPAGDARLAGLLRLCRWLGRSLINW
ncbi:Hypersensitive-induced response protein-like protein 2 [Durusdinium trenchii]|uniref:Hypersensitive-induced response protein-like protein 2 n=1 Tax=Durusdinium trenchii TaxID=1381693 RepID=A0ABP0SCR6_9DINO